MGEKNNRDTLRARAERRLTETDRKGIEQMSAEDIAGSIHELETHQIELEMQNTELRQAQAALAEAHDRYVELYDFAPVGYLTLDEKGLIVQANLTLANMLGVSRDRLIRQPFSAYIVPEDQDIYFAHKRDLLETKNKQTCELRLSVLSGEDLWVGLDSLMDKGHGQILTTVSDITDRKRVEQELNLTLRQSLAWLEYSPVCTKIVDRDYNLQYMSRSGTDSLSVDDVSELYGKPYPFEFYPESFRKLMIGNMKKARDTGEVVTQESPVVDVEGNTVWFQSTIVPMNDEEDQFDYFLVISVDTTEHKQFEEEKERIARLPAENPNAVLRVSAQGVLEYANEAAATFISELGVEVGGRVNSEWQARIDEAMEMARPISIQLKAADRTFAATLTPITGQSYVNLYATDITESIRLEDQLRQSQKMEAIGQLAGGMAHDFNNLLQIISGYVELSEMSLKPDDALQSTLEEIGKAARRGKNMIKQLLAFSRRQVMSPEDMDLNELIEPIIQMVSGLIGEHIELDFIKGHNLETIAVDRGLMEQVVINLAVNARDAMPEGGKLTIKTENVLIDDEQAKTHPDLSPGRYVLLRVSDTGCGMSRRTLDHVFEPFFTTKEVGQGTGLGLSTVFGIIKQHHGNVTVSSELDKETTFDIYLPVVERKAAKVPRKVLGPVSGGTETILVAEDEETVLLLAKHLLQTAGYRVLTAKDGEEAVRVFREHADEVDAVMFDVVMPRMGGKKALEEIKKIRPNIPHLFASGYSENTVHTNFIQTRGLHLLSKPYRSETLLRTIRQLLDESK